MQLTREVNFSLVHADACQHLYNTDKPFILVLREDENLFEAILQCANTINLQSASISGLGGLKEISVAYYELAAQQYHTRVFKEMHELISMNGNISFADGKRFLHIHAALGNHEYDVMGGHLMDAIVCPMAEITIVPLASPIYRQFDAKSGLKALCPLTRE